MGAVDAPAPRGHDKKKKKHKKHRVGVRLDMTPMVDVAFLLLTFFMLTTSMSKPQTMEINLPPSEAKVEVAQSNLLTIRMKEDGTIYKNFALDPPSKMAFTDLQKFLRESLQQNPKLITLLKVDRKGKFKMMVDLIDELNLAEITRFSIAPMLEEDIKILEKATQ
ncbi:MAG: biopolymer transporter ExbD [Ignavibacteriales bacterium]|nr:biopolymer transporter ExbD [Ignavibacteriales bacterium]